MRGQGIIPGLSSVFEGRKVSAVGEQVRRSTFESYDDLVAAAAAAMDWLAQAGFEPGNTRLGRVCRLVEDLRDAWKVDSDAVTLVANREGVDRVYSAIEEVYQLAQIHEGLRAREICDELSRRIRKYLSGPDLARDERTEKPKTIAGRDYGFELTVGSHLSSAGFGIRWPATGDLTLRFPNGSIRSLYVECKRPKSVDSVRSNVLKAAKQLEGRYSSARRPHRVRGMVAVSVTKATHPGSAIGKASDRRTMADELQAHATECSDVISEYLRGSERPQTIASLVEFRCLYEADGALVPCSQYCLSAHADRGSQDLKLLRKIGGAWQSFATPSA